MRTLIFWFGIACAALAGFVDPVWGYATVAVLALVQLVLLSNASGGSVFLLIHYTTLLTYFSLAPAMQIATDSEFWDAGVLMTASHTQALMLLLLYMAGVEIARFGMADMPGRITTAPAPRAAGVAHPVLLLGCALVAFGALFVKPGLNFVARGVVGLAGEDDAVPIDYIVFSTLPKLLVAICFVALAVHAWRRRTLGSWLAAGLCFVLAAVATNPVNTPRQILLIGFLPLLIMACARHRRWLLAAAIFGAIAGLGPVFNLISRGSMWGEDLMTFPFSPDFDAQYVVAGILERAPIPELGWGRYLLSAFSFFLPRDLKMFPDFDPLGWSTILGNFSQSNLSLPPFTTAYFDFGLAGPVLLGLAVSALFRKVDKAIDPNRALSGGYLAALVLLAAYVPFMRGPILGWGPFATAGLIAAMVAGLLSTRFGRPQARPLRRSLPAA